MATVTSLISTLLQPVAEKAAAEAVGQCFIAVNIKEEMSNLSEILRIIKGALPEAEEKKDGNPNIRNWLRKLDDICYEARDMLDEFVTVSASIKAKRASKRVTSNSLPFFSLRRFVISSSLSVPAVIPLRLRCRLANNIRSLRKRLDGMKNDKVIDSILEFGKERDSRNAPLSHRSKTGNLEIDSPNAPICYRPGTGPSLEKQRDLFVGREVQKEIIMDKLLNYKDDHVDVVPICGMGGVGKTTLAQSVYNDEKVTQEMYPIKKWLCVGETKFNAKEIILKITNDSNTNDVEACQEKLKEKLKRSRFLIVLDDVWDIDSNEWELFYNPLTEIGKGGLVIITTREKGVISAIGIQVPDYLKPLEYEDSWKIFESHAFINGNSCSDFEQKKCIGEQIVKKLKGLPLALKVVARSLLNESDIKTWKNFLEYQNVDSIMSALRRSYNNLPPHLKQCFAYCSLFPKDCEFDEKMLVKMWMAHGFIENVGGGAGGREKKRPEDIGALCFKQLVNASLFQCVDGEYKMHDLIHDLAMLVSTDEIVRTEDSLSSEQMEKARHVSITEVSNYWENLRMCNSRRLVTLYSHHNRYNHDIYSGWIPKPSECNNIIQDIFKQLKSLRVLVLVSIGITYIPDCISELIHLRYLDISKTHVSRIPDSLCDLYNLQTLLAPIGTSFAFLPKNTIAILPKNIVNMANLRHLRACLTTCKGVKNLASLQELHSISICKDDNISELGDMRQLHGELTIEGLENVTSSQDATEARMQDKTYLERLSLVFTSGLGKIDVQAEVLDALRCPPNLTDLNIKGYNGLTTPSWMSDGNMIANLQNICLTNCHRLELLPPLGQLNSLKHITIDGIGAIKRLGDEFYGKGINRKVFFRLLKTLRLSNLENLKKWNSIPIDNVMFFPMLVELNISYCPKLVSVLPPIEINTSNMNVKDPSKNFANVMGCLSKLKLNKCDGLAVLELGLLWSLRYLYILNCSKLTRVTSVVPVAAAIELPSNDQCQKLEKKEFESLCSITRLSIHGCNELMSFPRLVRIEILNVVGCEKLRSLSISLQGWNSLQYLQVINCPKLEEVFEDNAPSSSSSTLLSLPPSRLQVLDIDNKLVFKKLFKLDLVSLKEMHIEKFHKVKCFNKIAKNNWHKLKFLESLEISKSDDLESLPLDIHKLSSLKQLRLYDCPKLKALPENGLPHSLEKLIINRCPLLYERCEDVSGLDWHKIKHVRQRKIERDDDFFQG